jgi:NosR/NirI family transcriptional regulator, nitrous oxide reductase regulator
MSPLTFARALLVPAPVEPSYPRVPQVDAVGRASVPGVFVIGDAAGTPLLKLGLNAGARAADALCDELDDEPHHEAHHEPQDGRARGADGEIVDVVVVGAGAAGLACAARVQRRGLRVRVLESQELLQTVVSMTREKQIFAEPLAVRNDSDLWFEETTREALLERWRSFVAERALDVRAGEAVLDVAALDGARIGGARFRVRTSRGEHLARRVVVAIGKSGSPRRAGVQGADRHADKIRHALPDASAIVGQRVLVYGGGDVACEAALALCARNEVALVTVDPSLTFPHKRNREAVEEAAAAGKLALHLGARLLQIEEQRCSFKDASGAARTIENDLVYEMIGADPPVAFFKKLGLALEGEWGVRRYLLALAVFVGVYSLYALKKFPELPHAWPFTALLDQGTFAAAVHAAFDVAFLPFSFLFTEAARADISRTLWFQQGYLYSLAYTIAMLGFGWQAMMRWTATAKRPAHQRWRYLSLLSFQVAFFLIANVVAVQGLSIEHSWRAWGLYQPWPLFFHTFHWWQESDPAVVKWGFIAAGLIGTFIVIPLLSWKNGKRFCTWVCGCGGLAETLGDRWRHLAPKGRRSRAWEFQGFVVLLGALLATAVSVGMYQTRADNGWALAYGYVVDFWLVAVIPIALYPFFGGKIWCRYWCPLAAWNQLLARLYGRLGIDSNDRCISCGQCSKQCQVGVDVMQLARAQERLDNKNSSCIQCGICIDVCPVDVLSFSTTKPPSAPKAVGRSLPIVR